MADSQMPKLLYALDTLDLGGAELSVLELVRNIKNFEIHVVVVYRSKHDLRREFESLGIKLYFLNISERFGFWEGTVLLKRIVSVLRPELIHATHFRTEIISRLALLFSSTPLVCTLISDTYSVDRYALVSKREVFKLELYKWLNRATAFRSNRFISVSQAIVKPNKRYLWIKDSKITVIPNGRDVDYFVRAISYQKVSLFPAIMTNEKIIVSNSRVIKSKGFEEIFLAFEDLHKKYGTFYLLIVGDGRDLSVFKQMAADKGFADRVLFLGSRSDVASLLKSSDIFWFASHYEGSPGVLIEGMLANIPIIASDIEPVKENLIHNYNGLLFNKGSWRDLVEKTEYLVSNWQSSELLVRNAYSLAAFKFDIRRVAKQHEEVYRQIISSQ